MQYIASLSYGKDSIAMLEVISKNGLPLDRIVHVDVYDTPTISAILPDVLEFQQEADKEVKRRYKIEVEHIHEKSFEELFYRVFQRGKHIGLIRGFPHMIGRWCSDALKISPLNSFSKGGISYIGYAQNEYMASGNMSTAQCEHAIDFYEKQENAFISNSELREIKLNNLKKQLPLFGKEAFKEHAL